MSKSLHFDKSIEKLEVLFKYSGININNEIITPMDMIKHRWLYVFNLLTVLSLSLASIYYIIIGIANRKNMIELTSIAPCLTFTILAISKSYYHYLNEEYIKELLFLLRKLEIKENAKEECEDKKDIIKKKETGFLSKVINVLYALNFSMIIVFNITPLIMIAVKYFKTDKFELLLPYLDLFTFIPYELKYWPFAYVHQIWSVCVALLFMGGADYLFYTCSTYVIVQFKLLQYDFERIIPACSSFNEFQEDTVRKLFLDLVKWHQDLIHTSNILEIIYSKSTLFNFLASSVVICLTGFNVTMVNDIVTVITFLTFLSMGLMQIFFLCFFADMMTSASEEVSTAVYNTRWYVAQTTVGRQFLIMQTRAQVPCKLTAAGFAEVNLKAFTRILSTAWSYFALLQTMYEGY